MRQAAPAPGIEADGEIDGISCVPLGGRGEVVYAFLAKAAAGAYDEDAAAIASALYRALRDQAAAQVWEYLGFPANSEAWRRVRDWHLQRAAYLVKPLEASRRGRHGAPIDRRVQALVDALAAFAERWKAWSGRQRPPPYASDVEQHLFWAYKCPCDPPPMTRQALKRIVAPAGELVSPSTSDLPNGAVR